MARQDDIELLLSRAAPLLLDVARKAQVSATAFAGTDWVRANLVRTASVNQVAGTARWRMVGDGIVARQKELPRGLTLSTTDEEQNQGRYYLHAVDVAVILTIRRKPHREEEQPAALQLQMQSVIEQAPVAYKNEIVVYLAVPPLGKEPTFEVATKGAKTVTYRLADLVAEQPAHEAAKPLSTIPTPAPTVSSAMDREQEGDSDSQG